MKPYLIHLDDARAERIAAEWRLQQIENRQARRRRLLLCVGLALTHAAAFAAGGWLWIH